MKEKRFMRKLLVGIVISLLVIVFFKVAFYIRAQLIHEYDMGVYYYERGDYIYAAHIFSQLKGLGGSLVEISPEEYYNLSMEKLKETNPRTIICPNCGVVIEPVMEVK